tara:strand:+ start:1071 stop:1745 length:675 start_codon:yes stop_codon:yes gene_type:complete
MKGISNLIFIILLIGCSSKSTNSEEIIKKAVDKIESSSFDYGYSKKGLYKNNYFNFKMKFDTTWHLQSQKQLNKLVQEGKKMLKDSSKLKEAIEASEIKTAYLFAVFKYKRGSKTKFNPSLIILAENTKKMTDVKKGADYLFHVKENLIKTKLNYIFNDGYYSKIYANKKFDILTAHLKRDSLSITQKYLTSVTGRFTLSMIVSYSSDKEKKELDKILNSMKAI